MREEGGMHMNAAHMQEPSSATLHGEHVETLMLEGELGPRELEALGAQLLARARRGARYLVVDFSEVTHLNYRGVRPLVTRVQQVREAGGDVKLSGLSPYLAAILRVSGAHDAFECYPHMSDARAAFALARAPFV
jgi:anti-anti-sigma factor